MSMAVKYGFFLCAGAAAVLLAASCANSSMRVVGGRHRMSVLEAIIQREKYNGELIIVQGYLGKMDDSTYLYAYKEDWLKGRRENALLVDLYDSAYGSSLMPLISTEGYVLIEGWLRSLDWNPIKAKIFSIKRIEKKQVDVVGSVDENSESAPTDAVLEREQGVGHLQILDR